MRDLHLFRMEQFIEWCRSCGMKFDDIEIKKAGEVRFDKIQYLVNKKLPRTHFVNAIT